MYSQRVILPVHQRRRLPAAPELVGPQIFWIQDENDLWGATISGNVVTPALVLAGTGNTATGFEDVDALGAAVISGESWVYAWDQDLATGQDIMQRVKSDGTGFQTIANASTVLGIATGSPRTNVAVNKNNGDSWIVTRHGGANTEVSLIKITLAGAVTIEKTFPNTAYEYGNLQYDSTNDLIALTRGNAVDLWELYDVTDFTAPIETIPTTWTGVGRHASFLMTDDKLYLSSDETMVRYDRSTYVADAPNPWNSFTPNIIDLGVVKVGADIYTVNFNDTSGDEELLRLTGDGGAGTLLTGWPPTIFTAYGFTPT